MNIIVCVKQVPDTAEVRIDPVTNTLVRQGVPSIVNPYDRNAVEAALALRDSYGGKVTVLSMGPPQAAAVLKECIAMGADEAVLVSDRAVGGADTLATSYTLAAAVKKIGDYDLILCGLQAIDGDTGQVGPEMAEHLGITQVTYVNGIEGVENGFIRVHRQQEGGYDLIDAQLPAMLSVVKTINKPRYPTVWGIMRAVKEQEIKIFSAKDLDVDMERLGLKGSATQVREISTPPRRTGGKLIQKADAREAVEELMANLQSAGVL